MPPSADTLADAVRQTLESWPDEGAVCFTQLRARDVVHITSPEKTPEPGGRDIPEHARALAIAIVRELPKPWPRPVGSVKSADEPPWMVTVDWKVPDLSNPANDLEWKENIAASDWDAKVQEVRQSGADDNAILPFIVRLREAAARKEGGPAVPAVNKFGEDLQQKMLKWRYTAREAVQKRWPTRAAAAPDPDGAPPRLPPAAQTDVLDLWSQWCDTTSLAALQQAGRVFGFSPVLDTTVTRAAQHGWSLLASCSDILLKIIGGDGSCTEEESKRLSSVLCGSCRGVVELQPYEIVTRKKAGHISYNSGILDAPSIDCVVSFPGKCKKEWDQLVAAKIVESVACVFLESTQDGLGEHVEDPDHCGRCYCKTLYGEVSANAFLRILERDVENYDEEKEFAQADAEAMGQVFLEQKNYRDADWLDEVARARRKAEGKCTQARRTAPWGCKWFHEWKLNVGLALEKNQRPVVYYCKGEKGKGKVKWEDLSHPTKRMPCFGLGASQKAEVAYLDHMGIQYTEKEIPDDFRDLEPDHDMDVEMLGPGSPLTEKGSVQGHVDPQPKLVPIHCKRVPVMPVHSVLAELLRNIGEKQKATMTQYLSKVKKNVQDRYPEGHEIRQRGLTLRSNSPKRKTRPDSSGPGTHPDTNTDAARTRASLTMVGASVANDFSVRGPSNESDERR